MKYEVSSYTSGAPKLKLISQVLPTEKGVTDTRHIGRTEGRTETNNFSCPGSSADQI
jgi:hypothetical protein